MQGFNMGRYVPPDQEGIRSGNALHGSNAAQKRTASGVPIVRFEMPFAIWCDGCQNRPTNPKHHPVLIAQGIRFNAEKHPAGRYYSTPIWAFRMRHPACGAWLEIRTDPAHTTYVVTEGGRRRREYDDEEDGGDDGREGGLEAGPDARAARAAAEAAGMEGALPLSSSEDARLDAFDRLERTIAHREVQTVSSAGKTRLDALAAASDWRTNDPYARNRELRAAFRAGRHAREDAATADAALRQRLGGLDEGLVLLPATEEDARYAALVDFGRKNGSADVARETLEKPLFAMEEEERQRQQHQQKESQKLPKGTTEATRRQQAVRNHLTSTVLANTRRKKDPFLDGWQANLSTKRKRGTEKEKVGEKGKITEKTKGEQEVDIADHPKKQKQALVSYDSDSS